MQKRQAEQAIPFGAQASVVQVANMAEPLLVQAGQIVIAFPELDMLFSALRLRLLLLTVEAFAQIFIFHLQLLVLFDQFHDLLLQRP